MTEGGSNMLIEDKAHCTIEYDPTLKCVIQTWKGFAGSQKFRASLLKTLEVFETQEATSIINNTQHSKVVAAEDLDWSAREIDPKLIECGLRKIALIVPQDRFTRHSLAHFRQNSGEHFVIQHFADLDEAKAWIAEQ